MAIVPANIPSPPSVRYLPFRGTRPTFTVSVVLPDPQATTAAARRLLDLVAARLARRRSSGTTNASRDPRIETSADLGAAPAVLQR